MHHAQFSLKVKYSVPSNNNCFIRMDINEFIPKLYTVLGIQDVYIREREKERES